MKRLTLLLLMIAVCAVGYGQKKEKPPKVAKAKLAMEEGNLEEAKTIIDRAIVHEKTKDKVDTWYYRGEIYVAIGSSENPIIDAKEAYSTAGEAFDKVNEMGNETNPTVILAQQKAGNILNGLLGGAYEHTQQDDYHSALKKYEYFQAFSPEDTIGYLYGGIAAEAVEEYDKAEEYYWATLDKGSENVNLIYKMLRIEKEYREDPVKAMEIAKKGFEMFPEDKVIASNLISLYIENEQIDDAKALVQSNIDNEPDNGVNYFNLGYLQEESGDSDAAIETYKKGIEMVPDYADNYVNLAVIMYNQFAEITNEVGQMDYGTYQKKGKALQEEAKGLLDEAVGYVEKAAELKPEDEIVLNSLYKVYSGLKRTDDAQAVYQKMEDLGFFDEGND